MQLQKEVQKAISRHEAHEPLADIGVRPIRQIETKDHRPCEVAVWLVVVLMWLLFALTFVLIWLRTNP